MVTISSRKEKLPFLFGSIRVKFFLTYIIVIAFFLIILNTYPLAVTRDFIFRSKYSTLRNEGSLIASSIEALDTINDENVPLVMGVLDMKDLDSILIVDRDKNVVYSQESDAADMSERYEWCIDQALQENDAFYSVIDNGAFASVFSRPVINMGRVVGAVCIMNYDAAQGGVIAALRSNLIRITVIVSIISIGICLFFTQRITASIREVLTGIRSVREGEYSYRIETSGHDEIALLADEFNSLTDKLQKTEEIRRQFVSDASHELKTPLASIQLLSDSIVQNDVTDKETITEFVTDIGDEARRLARTTEKLLRLTNLDNQVITEYKPENVSDIAEKTVKILTPIAKERDVSIISELEDDCIIMAYQDDIYQIMINLVENAIKYNVEGGKVFLTVDKTEDKVRLTVADTGVGIPEEDLPMIFDRFYRVDKARSRADGGSGLGLSIVKSSVEQYGGEIIARPRNEGGMEFTVLFDRYKEEQTR